MAWEKRFGLLCFPIFLLSGCLTGNKAAKPGIKPPTEETSLTIPFPVDHTFGQLSFSPSNQLDIAYKSIRLWVNDPQNMPPEVDYWLITHQSFPLKSNNLTTLRTHQKIVLPGEAEAEFKKQGFTQLKAPKTGERLLLKKDADFLFLTPLEEKNPTTNSTRNSYFLEFDNGRTLLVCDEITNPDHYREFLYELRDEGKGVTILTAPMITSEFGAIAETIALFQPTSALVMPPPHQRVSHETVTEWREQLKNQLYSGDLRVISETTRYPF